MLLRLEPMNTKEFGQRFRAAREAQGKKQEQVGAAAGMTRVAVSQWETGDIKKGVDAEKLWRAAEYLDVSVGYLLFGKQRGILLPSEHLAELWQQLTPSQKEAHLKAIEDSARHNAELLAELKK
jgi:transcriptional regulator with XRE-family HTH domain